MNLVLDIGNTNSKLALFHGNNLAQFDIVSGTPDIEHVQDFCHRGENIQKAILSTVRDVDEALMQWLDNQFDYIQLTPGIDTPVRIAYRTPETLGNDRLAAVVGAQATFSNQNILVIDMGTCITLDFLNDDGEYLGGSISPGLNLRFRSLNTFTGKLPLVSLQEQTPLIGDTTNSSIWSGVQHGIVAEIDGMIARYEQEYDNLQVVGTGGDFKFFEKAFKNSIFADPNLVLKGLNAILIHHDA